MSSFFLQTEVFPSGIFSVQNETDFTYVVSSLDVVQYLLQNENEVLNEKMKKLRWFINLHEANIDYICKEITIKKGFQVDEKKFVNQLYK